MQLTAILLTICSLTVAARSVSQSVTFSGKDVSLDKIFSVIKEQTGHFVLYKDGLLTNAKPVTVDAVRMPLGDFLSTIFKNQPLGYSVHNTSIIVEKINAAPKLNMDEVKPPITGRVVGPDGQPIAGANVVVKGTKRGTMTNADGGFSIEAQEDDILVISSVGYNQRQLNISASGDIKTIILTLSDNKLDEVQIIAYGQTTKRLNTGNVSSVKASEISQQPVNNPLLALSGRVPGITIAQQSGVSGSGIKIQIQGQNSLQNGNDPFYVIDGVPYIAQLLPNLGGIFGNSQSGTYAGTTGNPLSYLNPAEIESIDILKDAEATAIYGSRAANGAILITTKKGASAQMKVDLNLQQGWGKIARKLDLMNTSQYLEMRNEAYFNDDIIPSGNGARDLLLWDTTRDTDWQKELIGKTAIYSDVHASISGGTKISQYFVGAGYHRETTVFPGEFSDQKASLHINLNNSSPNNRFKTEFSANYMADNNRLPNTDFTRSAIMLPPVAPKLFNDDGSLNWQPDSSGNSTWDNPLRNAFNTYSNKTNNLTSNLVISYAVTSWMQLKANFGYTSLQTDEIVLNPITAVRPESRPSSVRAALFGTSRFVSWLVEPQIAVNRNIFGGKIDILVGSTIQQNNSDARQVLAYGHKSDLLLSDITAAPNLAPLANLGAVYKYNAAFGRINYNYNNIYLFNLSGRRDGSSRFGPRNRVHTFSALSGAWIFSSNHLFKKINWMSYGKLKLSYGSTGSDQIGDYTFLDLYRPLITEIGYQNTTGLYADRLFNPFLQWEETKKLQGGIEVNLFESRLLTSITFYRNRSFNQLLGYNLPATTGFTSIANNLPATVQNSGLELSVTTTNIQNSRFVWTTSINATIPKNRLIKFDNIENSSFANTYAVGKPISVIRLYHFLGLDPVSGNYQFSDKNGNPTSNPKDPDDKTVWVNTSPRIYGGIQNTFTYGAFNLDFLVQFNCQYGSNYKFGNAIPGTFLSEGSQPVYMLDRWRKEGDIVKYKRYTTISSFENSETQFILRYFTDASYTDASYIRLKNVAFSWQIPDRVIKTMKFASARIFIHAQNLLTITNYQGMDPENLSDTSLPPLRMITTGINITLK